MKKLVTLAVAAILIATLLVSLEGGKNQKGSDDKVLKYEIAEVLTTLPSTGDSMLNYVVNVYDNDGNFVEKIITELEVGYLEGDLVDPMEIHTTGR